jgi:hypothetical protein
VAWGAVKNAGYSKNKEGKWHKMANQSEETINEMSHDELRMKLMEVVSPSSAPSSYGYIQDVYDDYCIYSMDEELYKQRYKIKDGEVELVGEPQKVQREVSYNPIGDNEMSENQNCNCKQEVKTLVDGLISANKSWTEEDREWLQKQDEKMLKKLQAMESTPKPEPKKEQNQEKKETPDPSENQSTAQKPQQMSTEEYLKNAPTHIRKVLLSGLKAHEAEEKRLRDIVLSNETNQFTEDDLKEMEFSMLQKLAALAIAAQGEEKEQPVDLFHYNYQGAAGAPQANEKVQEEHLPLPVMNFSRKDEK